MKITEHFDSDEFGCHDGTPYPPEWIEDRLRPLCEMIEIIRSNAGDLPIAIDSGYRTLAYDEKIYKAHVAAVGDDGQVAPATRSQHPAGHAADIKHARLSPLAMFNLVLQLFEKGELPSLGGVGVYPSFIHVDTRPRPGADGTPTGGHLAVWGGRRPSNVV